MSTVALERPMTVRVGQAALLRLHAHAGTILGAAGVVLGANGLAVTYRLAEHSTSQWHFVSFWVSYALVLGSSLALALRARSDVGRVTALVTFGVATFLPKLLMTLNGPRYFDEYGHWRHANDIVDRAHVFVNTPYLPIQRYFPGLELLTAAIHWVTRMPTWHVGQLVIVVAHGGVLVVVWWMARQLDLPNRAAIAAAFFYGLNSSFLYFDAQYSYESLALPLAFTAVALAIGSRRAYSSRRSGTLAAASVVASACCIVSHHTSTLAMVALLVVVAAVVPARESLRADRVARWAPWAVAGLAAAGAAAWFLVVARPTYGYLEPHLRDGVVDALNWFRGKSTRTFNNGGVIETRRQLFGGSQLPIYEIACAFVAPLLAVGSVVVAVAEYRRDPAEGRRRLPLLAPFYLLVVLYLVSLPLTLSTTGAETAHRMWGVAYLGIAVVAASAVRQWDALMARFPARRVLVTGAAALLIVAIGNTAAGANVYYRFPGPDTFGTDTRSRSAELDQLATWMRHTLPAGSKVVTDRFTGLAVIGYTDLRVPAPEDYLVYRLYREGGSPTPRLRAYLRDHHFRYFVLDRRIGHLEPKQKLFQGYLGKESVSPSALRTVGTTPFLRVVHRTPTYLVLRISP